MSQSETPYKIAMVEYNDGSGQVNFKFTNDTRKSFHFYSLPYEIADNAVKEWGFKDIQSLGDLIGSDVSIVNDVKYNIVSIKKN